MDNSRIAGSSSGSAIHFHGDTAFKNGHAGSVDNRVPLQQRLGSVFLETSGMKRHSVEHAGRTKNNNIPFICQLEERLDKL